MVAPYILHGVWLSGPTYKVGLMLSLTGQKFDYEFVNLREGAHQKARVQGQEPIWRGAMSDGNRDR